MFQQVKPHKTIRPELDIISVRVAKGMKQEIIDIVESNYVYVNISDYVRRAIKDKLEREK